MKPLRVLVIEDDALIAMALAELLAALGHEVCATAATESEAVAAAARCDPDLMIVDAGLRLGSGISAVEEILRRGPRSHVVISGDAARVRLRKPDAVVVRKPFRLAELASAIDMAVDVVCREAEKIKPVGGTVTETVVPGDPAAVATRPPSCRVSASTMLVPSPVRGGASAKLLLIPIPSSETDRRQAAAVASKPTTIWPVAPSGKACLSALIVNSVAISPMLTACSEVVEPLPASTRNEIG